MKWDERVMRQWCALELLSSAVLLSVVLFGCTAQPVWRGKALSTWLEQLNSLNSSEVAAAEMAIRGIGTNAIPYLLEVLAAPESSFAEWIETGGKSEIRRTGAIRAFRVLGSTAVHALPALGIMLTNEISTTNEVIATAVVQSLAGIGEEAKPWLVSALDHPSATVRRASMMGLITLGRNAHDVLPQVMAHLKDEDPETRGLALFFITEVADAPELKFRVLKDALLDSESSIRVFAEKEIRKFTGTNGW